MTITVLVAADVDRAFHERVERDERFTILVRPAHDAATLARTVGDAEILVTRFHNEVTREVIESAQSLRLIVQGTSGLDNIDSAAAAERGVRVVGIPGENANAVAEIVIGHIIALTRTVPAYDRMVRSGEWTRSDCADRREVRGHRLGIVGLGRVGSRVAALASSFGSRPEAYDPYITDDDFVARGARRIATLPELLDRADILTLHFPLTGETRGMIDGTALDTLPAGAIVVNTSRGPVLDLEAALERLTAGRLRGLALDVYDDEPPRRSGWPSHPGLILTPHVAGCSAESKASIGRALYEKLVEYAEGRS
jgi:phosphoglycerate dehydrogenase-like enzyme